MRYSGNIYETYGPRRETAKLRKEVQDTFASMLLDKVRLPANQMQCIPILLYICIYLAYIHPAMRLSAALVRGMREHFQSICIIIGATKVYIVIFKNIVIIRILK